MGILLERCAGNLDKVATHLINELLKDQGVLTAIVDDDYHELMASKGLLIAHTVGGEKVIFDGIDTDKINEVKMVLRNHVIAEQVFVALSMELGYEFPFGRLIDVNNSLVNINIFVNKYEELRKTHGEAIDNMDLAYGIYQYFGIPEGEDFVNKEDIETYRQFEKNKLAAKENYLKEKDPNCEYILNFENINEIMRNLTNIE